MRDRPFRGWSTAGRSRPRAGSERGGAESIPIGPDDVTVTISVDARPTTFGDHWRAFWSDPFWPVFTGLVVAVGTILGFAARARKRDRPTPDRGPPSSPGYL